MSVALIRYIQQFWTTMGCGVVVVGSPRASKAAFHWSHCSVCSFSCASLPFSQQHKRLFNGLISKARLPGQWDSPEKFHEPMANFAISHSFLFPLSTFWTPTAWHSVTHVDSLWNAWVGKCFTTKMHWKTGMFIVDVQEDSISLLTLGLHVKVYYFILEAKCTV